MNAKLETRVWEKSRATKSYKLILLWLARNADKHGMITTSRARVANAVGVDRVTVGTAFRRLRDIGEIRTTPKLVGRCHMTEVKVIL